MIAITDIREPISVSLTVISSVKVKIAKILNSIVISTSN